MSMVLTVFYPKFKKMAGKLKINGRKFKKMAGKLKKNGRKFKKMAGKLSFLNLKGSLHQRHFVAKNASDGRSVFATEYDTKN